MTQKSYARRLLGAALGGLTTLIANGALSDASGPEFYRVIDVAPDDTLNMRTGPSPDFPVVSVIPHDADGIANLDCTGGLSLEEWSNATEAERRASLKTRWCLVGFERTVGWAAGWFLAEGGPDDRFDAGAPLRSLRGSEWRLIRLGETPIEAEAGIAFASDGMASGNAGCNRFSGSFEEDRGTIAFGPLASTRMACPDPQMSVETGFFQALEAARTTVAYHLVLAFLDDEMKVIAQFARTDWD